MKNSRLNRKTPLKSSQPDHPTSWNSTLRPRKPGKGEERFERAYGSEERVQAVKAMPCLVCGSTPSDNAHVTSRGAGGGREDIVPLCRLHHQEQHRVGIETFQERHNVDLEPEATRDSGAGEGDRRGEEAGGGA